MLRERAQLDKAIGVIRSLDRELDDAATLIELGEAEGDAASVTEGENVIRALKPAAEKRGLEALLSGEADGNDAFVEIHAGSGGTESQDWASMLLRMYMRWAESHDCKLEFLEESPGEVAGIKSATIKVMGLNAYGWLKTETGVHRLVRISPFDSNARRHTSFASVWVYPVVDDKIDIQVNEGDLRIDVYRASGAGGQHVNKTESAVRMTHLPTGIVVACQNDRSQHKNRAEAMKMLKGPSLRGRAQETRSGIGSDRSGENRYRLGSPDPLLRPAALSDGEGSPHRRADLGFQRRARWRYRPVSGGEPEPETQGRSRRNGRRYRLNSPALSGTAAGPGSGTLGLWLSFHGDIIGRAHMNGLIYLVGLVVVIAAVLSFLGFS
jgi:peptide chain release factor 2